MGFSETVHEVTAYFMTQYAIDSPPSRLKDCVETYLLANYSSEFVSAFTSGFLDRVKDVLVDEFNARFEKKHSLRFRFIDEIGEKIEGIGYSDEDEKIEFQNAINELSCSEFESLSAYILKIAGCETYWRTPESHDQGLDAFGYRSFLERRDGEWFAGIPRVILLAQAKHFSSCKVGSKDIREFIGSSQLAVHKIFSTIDDKYSDLEIPPFAPVALLFITTEEVPLTVKRLGVRSGMVILSSDDLYDLLIINWTDSPKKLTKDWFIKKLKECIEDIPKAK